MAFRVMLVLVIIVLMAAIVVPTAESQLSPGFYDRVCPQALPAIRDLVQQAVDRAPRLGAALLRLHFHDCFVNGCDASILLDGSESEKSARPNSGMPPVMYELIDQIKWSVDQKCGGPVVSCADILAVAARDSIVTLGGPWYQVPLGRRDAPKASKAATKALPTIDMNLQRLENNFRAQGLSTRDLVVLSSAHTVGFTPCRIAKPNLADIFLQQCQRGGNDAVVSFDPTPYRFDNAYYQNLMAGRGVLRTDQELFRGGYGETDRLVRLYSQDAVTHRRDFAQAMIKMGSIKPLTGNKGEIRSSCRVPNY